MTSGFCFIASSTAGRGSDAGVGFIPATNFSAAATFSGVAGTSSVALNAAGFTPAAKITLNDCSGRSRAMAVLSCFCTIGRDVRTSHT